MYQKFSIDQNFNSAIMILFYENNHINYLIYFTVYSETDNYTSSNMSFFVRENKILMNQILLF